MEFSEGAAFARWSSPEKGMIELLLASLMKIVESLMKRRLIFPVES